MFKSSHFIIFYLESLVYYVQGVNWALLAAGSNEYINYRHQADICHAYQILHKNGIPDERIVVMMYDDIAYHYLNPVKGNLINKVSGPNVYPGVPKDYTGKNVTSTNFLNILQGKSEAMRGIGSGKVINSGPEDNIFVYFSDHGAQGVVGFPDGSVLHASELNSVIKNMHTQKQYGHMLIYIEACESGSMFECLLNDRVKVYATTAATSKQSSYACCLDQERRIYVGDYYSVSWMEDSDAEDITREWLQKQYRVTKRSTPRSHVQQFGNLTMPHFFRVSDFQGEKSSVNKTAKSEPTGPRFNPNDGGVRSEDVHMTVLKNWLSAETDSHKITELKAQISALKKLKRKTVATFREIVSILTHGNGDAMNRIMNSRSKLLDHACYVPVIDHFLANCFSAKNEYALRNFYQMVNLCEDGFESGEIKRVIDQVCVNRLEDFTNDF